MTKTKGRLRKSLSKADAQICSRIKEVRRSLRLTQKEFAAQIAITRQRLASYEECRAPLRFNVANLLCERFDINQRWLAEGEAPRRPYIPIPREVLRSIPDRSLFSETYDSSLKNPVASSSNKLRALDAGLIPERDEIVMFSESIRRACVEAVDVEFSRLPEPLQHKFMRELYDFLKGFDRRNSETYRKPKAS